MRWAARRALLLRRCGAAPSHDLACWTAVQWKPSCFRRWDSRPSGETWTRCGYDKMTWIEQLETAASWPAPWSTELDSPVDDLVNTGTTGMLVLRRRSSRMTTLTVRLRNSQEYVINNLDSFALRFVPSCAADRPRAGPASCEELFLAALSCFLSLIASPWTCFDSSQKAASPCSRATRCVYLFG